MSTWREFCSNIHVPRGAKIIGAIANEVPREPLRNLIWAAELIKVVRDDMHFILFRGQASNRLERFRDRIGVADRVHFVGLPAESASVLPHLDVFWSGTGRGQSSLLLEALASGVPLMAIDTSPNRTLLGNNGRLFSGGNVATIARETLRILDDETNRWAATGATRNGIMTRHRPVEACNQYLRIYRELSQSR
jgi:glycosyltransferase involved in cell wall biosynthesis